MTPPPFASAQHKALRDAVREALGAWRRFVVAIDGVDGVGKSTLARWLSWQLGMPSVETDLFLAGGGLRYRQEDLKAVLLARLKQNRPVIVEGICVLETLEALGLGHDYLIRVADEERAEGSDTLGSELSSYLSRYPNSVADWEFEWSSRGTDLPRLAGRPGFLLREFHSLSARGALQHASVYASDVDEAAKGLFRSDLSDHLSELASQYQTPVTDDEHVQAIADLANAMSSKHPTTLRDGRFRIGPAQKALNLCLKYWWCAGWILKPPHCPIDASVLARVPGFTQVRWTRLDDLRLYNRIIERAREVASPQSLAEWELGLWNAR